MKVSSDQLDRIREATNIVDLVSEHVRLKKRGRNFIGLCPFHQEKTPSFNVLEDRGIFKCFGCGKGGDAFTFVMELEGLTFPEAIRKLAERAHIEIEGSEAEADNAARGERESIYHALREAAAYYYRTLRAPSGEPAQSYLRLRAFDVEILKKFGLGFAPHEQGSLTKHLTKQGIELETLERAGLIGRRDSGETYERFRGRLMFPVFNKTGKIVGFGGRILPDSNKNSHSVSRKPSGPNVAKYINSPDTEVYHKSQILYGLFQAKDTIRKAGFAILVEGYADVLAVFQSGTENVVAASGTSLTVEQLQLLRSYTTNIVLLFDADTAGKNATIRGIELAIEAGFDVSTVILPGGEDPDSFIRLSGSEAFESALEHRQTFIETKAQIFEEQGAFRDPARMTQAIRSIVETIAKVPDSIKRALFIQKLGERFHLSEQLLFTELAKYLSTDRPSFERPDAHHYHPSNSAEEESFRETELQIESSDIARRVEGMLLEAMLMEPQAVDRLIESSDFSLESILSPAIRELISYLLQRVDEGDPPTIAQLLDEFRGKQEFESLLTTYGMPHTSFSGNWDEHAEENGDAVARARQAIDTLQRNRITKRQTELSALVRSEKDSDEYLREIMALKDRPEVRKKLFQQLSEEETHD